MNDRLTPIGAGRPTAMDAPCEPSRAGDGRKAESFVAALEEAKTRQVAFSRHAIERIERRDIPLTPDDIALLSDGIARAEQKGSRDLLLLMGDTAFVVNVQKRTVVTAMDQDAMREKTFTHIDSAILLSKR